MNIRSIFLTILVITCTGLLFNQCSQTTKKTVPISDTGPDGSDTSVTIDGDFSIPELQIKPSPEKAFSLDCGSEKIVAYDISPTGAEVAYIAEYRAGLGLFFRNPIAATLQERFSGFNNSNVYTFYVDTEFFFALS
jgi:hypothetical protein